MRGPTTEPRQRAASKRTSVTQRPRGAHLLNPLIRRDVRVVEGARLESVCRGNSTVGSNPTLSATQSRRCSHSGIAPGLTAVFLVVCGAISAISGGNPRRRDSPGVRPPLCPGDRLASRVSWSGVGVA